MKKILMLLLLTTSLAFAQVAGDYQSVISDFGGDWNSFESWQVYDGTKWNPAVEPDYPNSTSHSVYIISGSTINLNSSSVSVNNLTINSGGLLTYGGSSVHGIKLYGNLTVNGTLGSSSDKIAITLYGTTQSISGSGSIDLQFIKKTNAGATTLNVGTNVNLWQNSAPIANTDGGTLAFNLTSGTLSIKTAASINPSGITFDFHSGTGTVEYPYSGDQTVVATTYNNLTLSGSGTKTTSSVTVNGTLTVSGSASVSMTTCTLGTYNFSGTGGLTINAGTTSIGGAFTYSSSGVLTVTGQLDISGTFNYSSSNTMSVGGTANLNGDANFTGTGALTVNGTLSAAATKTLSYSATGALTLSGTVNLNGTTNISGTCVVNITAGTTSVAESKSFNYSTSGTLTITGTLSVSGTFNLAGSGSISGSPTYGGSSTLKYSNTSAQIMTSNEFNIVPNLTIANPAGVVLNANSTITGTLTINSGCTFNTGSYTFQAGGLAINGTYSGSGGLTLIAGSISGGGTLSKLTISTGTVTNSGSLTISDSFILTSGTFNNSGTVIFSNPYSTPITITRGGGTWGTVGTITYSVNVNIDYTGGTSTGGELPTSVTALNNLICDAAITLASDAVVNGTLTLNNTLNLSSYMLTLKNAIAGTNTNLTAGSSSKITIAGTATGIIIPTSVSSLHTLVINNSNGTNLQANLTVANTLTCTSGNLNTNGYTLTWNGSSLTEATNRYVIGTMQTTKNVVANEEQAFGNIGLELSAGTGSACNNVTVTRYAGPGSAVNVGSNTGINRKYTISTSGTLAADRKLTIHWVSSDDNSKTLTSMQLWRYNGTTWEYESLVHDATTRSLSSENNIPAINNGSLTYTATDTFSPLPVELTEFVASTDGSKVNLAWTTATEVNNYGFDVERTVTGSDGWIKVGFVSGAGNSNSPKEYSFTDEPMGGLEFQYRLKQIDLDGAFDYSDAVNVVLENVKQFALDQNYPNPANPTTTIKFSVPSAQLVTLKVYDILGREVASLINEVKSPGNYEVKFDGTGLSSGVYLYRMQADNYSITKKLILMK